LRHIRYGVINFLRRIRPPTIKVLFRVNALSGVNAH
jgi:hypothetical protein